ncbi:hypothetical protein DOH76_12255 [Salmonella enterica subsp. enterica serovar Oranienburg]|nr:hypothetical protein [Salmonella enterica]EBG5026319.1 hypothetical protein [Salmonella enterica subsp. enterica serovar Oranienburg]EAS1262631.1 hypothetical protein [Salmonella enterica]EBB1604433.1 hypothetical protein [Salmonella enterica]EBB9533836.1 hypothetical protein [Salmonella enterica]
MDMEALKSDYCAGVLSIQKVADKHGVSKSTLIDWAKKYGWVRKKRGKKNPSKIPSKKSDQNSNGRTDGRTEKNAGKTSGDKDYYDYDAADDSDENCTNSPTAKPRRGSRYDPPTNAFAQHNSLSLKHGAYARRRLLADDVTIDTLNTELQGELFLVRAGNMLAVTEIGKWTAQMEDATPEEQKNLRELIAAAEKGIMRNIARIESIEFTLRNNLRVEAATAKLRAETQRLTAENQGVTTPLTEAIDELQSLNKGGKP